jgi:hypothetical protein
MKRNTQIDHHPGRELDDEFLAAVHGGLPAPRESGAAERARIDKILEKLGQASLTAPSIEVAEPRKQVVAAPRSGSGSTIASNVKAALLQCRAPG